MRSHSTATLPFLSLSTPATNHTRNGRVGAVGDSKPSGDHPAWDAWHSRVGLLPPPLPVLHPLYHTGRLLCFLVCSIMGGSKLFEEFESVFGEAKLEWEGGPAAAAHNAAVICPFLFHLSASDATRLEVVASDFRSQTWGRSFTVPQLEDMKDDIGIGGSCSEFVDYLISSVSSGNVRLILSTLPNLRSNSSVVQAKLIAQKSEGMPHISLSLNKLMSSSANDAIWSFSIALFKAYKKKHNDVVKEQECSLRLTGLLSSERDKNESLKQQLDDSKASYTATLVSNTFGNCNTNLVSVVQQPSAKYATDIETQSTNDPQYTRFRQSESPVYRRAKGRGVFLPDI